MANKALSFDGVDDRVFINIDEPETEVTHELWFKTDNPNGGLFSITNGDVNNTNGNDRDLYLQGGNIVTRIYNNETISTSGLNVADGKWHHVAHVFGDSIGGQKLYVDGALVAIGSNSQSAFYWQTKAIIGFSNDSFGKKFFNGVIDEVRIWNKARSQAQIKANMNKELTGKEAGLLAYYKLNEGSGGIAFDQTLNNFDGSILGIPTWTSGFNLYNGKPGNDTLTGSKANDKIDGKGGDDLLNGGGGNDTVIGNTGNDIVMGEAGNDQLQGNDGIDILIGGAGNDNLNGGAGDDNLIGGTNNDVLVGDAGKDILTGGYGADTFVFVKSTEGADIITDFAAGSDKIRVDASNFGGGLTPGSAIKTTQFVLGKAATTAAHRFIYDNLSGNLYFDKDGTGGIAKVMLGNISSEPALTNTNILVVA